MGAALQLGRIAAGTLGVAAFGKALDFSTDGQSHQAVTYLGFYGLAAVFAVIAGVIWVVIEQRKRTSAAAVPERIPPTIRHTLDGDRSLRLSLRPGRPQTVIFEPGVDNPNANNIDGVHANILFSEGIKVAKCDRDGKHSDRGDWLTTKDKIFDESEPTWKDYWSGEGITLAGEGHLLAPFKLHLREPGTYYVRTKLYGGGLPKAVTRDDKIVVEAADEVGHPELLGEVIYDAERLRDSEFDEDNTDSGVRTTYANWVAELSAALPADERQRRFVLDEPPKARGGAPERQYRIAQIEAKLPKLYELRRRLLSEGH